MKLDLKTIATFIGISASLAGIAGTWTLVQYRLDQLEQDQRGLAEDIRNISENVEEKGDEVRCLICGVHDIPCPGC